MNFLYHKEWFVIYVSLKLPKHVNFSNNDKNTLNKIINFFLKKKLQNDFKKSKLTKSYKKNKNVIYKDIFVFLLVLGETLTFFSSLRWRHWHNW
jgi:hypothetical protein